MASLAAARRSIASTTFVLTLVLLLVPAGANAKGGGGVLSISGRIGEVHLGSTLRAVRSYAGSPTRRVQITGENGVPGTEYRYECGRGCGTSYIFNGRGRLTNFITTSTRWRTAAGTNVGDALEDAEAAEGKQAKIQGCGGDTPTIYKRGRVALFINVSQADGDGPELITGFALAGPGSILGC